MNVLQNIFFWDNYVCSWKGKQCEVQADTSSKAQKEAAKVFQKDALCEVKSCDIHCYVVNRPVRR